MARTRCDLRAAFGERTPPCRRRGGGWRCLLLSLTLIADLPAAAADWVYTVVDGDNLWDLSSRFLDSTLRYEAVRRLNNIQQPRRMQPGTRIRFPMRWIRSNLVEAQVHSVQGSVELVRADGSRETLTAPGAALSLGDTLHTATDSSAAVRFADGSMVTLHQSSAMAFDHLSAHGQTGMVDSRLRLLDGRLDTHVKPAVGPGSRFEIHTPSAISAVRGTAYRAASMNDGGVSNIEVLEGRVAVSGSDRSRLVSEGFGSQIARDKPPAVPRLLLPPPQVTRMAQPIRAPDSLLTWQSLDGAVRYRVEIGAGQRFDVLSSDRIVDRPRIRLPDLADGSYTARVRGIDDSGLEGRNAVLQLALDTHPRPPIALQPANGNIVRDAAAELVWTDSAEAASYRLEIARDREFGDRVLIRDDITATRHTALEAVAPGTYYWRVTSIAADGEVGPAGDPRSWEVKAIPATVEATLSGDDSGLVATWRAAGPGLQYQVQLALDSEFGDLAIDRLTDEARLAIAPTPGQMRYLRVRIVEDDGYRGPWGTAQRIDPPADPFAWLMPALGVLGILLL